MNNVKNIIWFTLGIFFLLMGVVLLLWFNGFLLWQPILLFIGGICCIYKSELCGIIFDRIFPEPEELDEDFEDFPPVGIDKVK